MQGYNATGWRSQWSQRKWRGYLPVIVEKEFQRNGYVIINQLARTLDLVFSHHVEQKPAHALRMK
jgi:hypothetical protein